MEVGLAESDEALREVAPLLLQLRTAFDQESLIRQIKAQQACGYRIACARSQGKVVCVAGFVVATKLAWGRHLYIDDLVSDEANRSAGAGKRLIDWLKSYAKAHGCGQIHLDSGVQRFGAHRFYLREGFHISSHHFSLIECNR